MSISIAQKYFSEAEKFRENGLYKEAVESYKKAIEADPFFASAYYNLALLYYQTQQFDNAIINLKKVTELDPNDTSAFNNIGVLYFTLDRFAEAKKYFEKALLIDTNYKEARNNLEKVQQKLQMLEVPSFIKQPAEAGSNNKRLLEECQKLKTPRKILIVMDEGIGNMIMLTPSLRAIMKVLPDSEITVLGKTFSLEILAGLGVKTINEPESDAKYDIGFYSIWSANYQRIYGEILASQCRKGPFQIMRDDLDLHEANYHMKIAESLGYNGHMPDSFCAVKEIDIPWNENDKVVALSDTTLDHPEWQRKKWPYYKELARKLTEKGFKIALIGGTAEAAKFNPDGWPEVYNLLGKYNLLETAGALKKCTMFIGNDSGPAHIAASIGINTFVLFGPTRISKNRPLGPKSNVIRLDLPCSPCQYTGMWNTCNNWRCMNELTVERVLSVVIDEKNAHPQKITADQISFGKLQLVGKNYKDCSLVEKDNIKYVVRGNIKEPLRVHLVGARRANFPWGMENEIMRALTLAGIEVVDTDYRLDTNNFSELFLREAHLMLVCKGSGIHPELIKKFPGRTILWYQDDIFTTAHAPRDLTFNGHAFDTVYSFDKSAINEYKKLRMNDVRHLALAMSPAVHRKMFLPKIHDVSFVGNIHPNRKPFLEKLQKRFNVFITRAFMDEMVRIFNQSKIILNLGIGPTGIQQRVFETLGCGSCLITNEIPVRDRLFEDQKHLIYFKQENIEDLIEYYLNNAEEREVIAKNGYLEAHSKHTFAHRIAELIADHFPRYELIGEDKNKKKEPNPIEISKTASGDLIKTAHPNKRHLRIFAAFANVNWENYNLQPALEEFGEVVRYDWLPQYNQYDPQWHWGKKQQMNMDLFQFVKKAHEEKPIDVFFGYLSGRLVSPGIVRAITMMEIPTLNLALDDKSKFLGNLEPTGFAGPADIASAFTLCWTSTKDAVQKYKQLGAKVVYMPAGANPHFFKPMNLARDIDICFIGQNYGVRQSIIKYLRDNGINIQVFGKGWESGEIPMENVVELISRSKITLGIGTDTIQYNIVALKGRDFEVPTCGGFYLTQYNPELEEFYDIGKEIVCYNSLEDMLEKIRYYLSHPEDAEEIRKAALKKSLAEHTWKKRFNKAFDIMGINI